MIDYSVILTALEKIFNWILLPLGLIGGVWALYDKWKNRKPKLYLFVPYNWSGVDSGSKIRFLCIYLKISNVSSRSAFIYFETISISLLIDNHWYVTYFIDADIKQTDLSDAAKRHYGIDKAKVLNRFGENIVTYDTPLCGYVIVGHQDGAIFTKSIEKIRIEVEDCHRKKYTLYADLKKQLDRDPYKKYEESLKKNK